jgi:hypothetical protein
VKVGGEGVRERGNWVDGGRRTEDCSKGRDERRSGGVGGWIR